MFGMLQERLMPIFSATSARRMGRAGLHLACMIALAGLAIQLALGMILNLYIAIPADDARISFLREVETAPAVLTVHALVALLLLATAGIMLLRAIALRDTAVITIVAAGLVALLGAFASGELYVRDDKTGASLSMAILTSVALLCYVGLQAIISRQRPRAQVPQAQVPQAREGQAQVPQAQVPQAREPQAPAPQAPQAREGRR